MSKKSKAAAQEVTELSGPCAYITYTVSRVSSLKASEASSDECQNAPTCMVRLKGPTLDEPCTSEACSISDVGSYQLNYSAQSKHALTTVHQELPKFLNSPLVVEVLADEEIVGHAQLDLIPVASQAAASVQARLNLTQVQAEWTLASNANLTVAVSFTRDAPEVSENPIMHEEQESGAAAAREQFIPFHLVDVSTVSESTVCTLGPANATDLPSRFLSTTASIPSGLGVRLALLWRTSTSWAGVSGSLGTCSSAVIAWDSAWRTLIKPEDFTAMKDAIENGSDVFVEVARYLVRPEEGIDAAFNNYHAVSKLPAGSIENLRQPGCKKLQAVVQFEDTFSTVASTFCDNPLVSMLPPRPPDASKAKPIEAALSTKGSGEEGCGWMGCKFQLDISFTNAVIPEWQPPPKPNKTLHEILPKRPDQKTEAESALRSYHSSLQGIINRLMKEYVACDADSSKEFGRKLQPLELRKKLIFQLNRSGLYVDMKEKLRESMYSIAREKFDAETAADIAPICNPLYAFMLDEIHANLNQAMGVECKSSHEDNSVQLEMARIATECEMQGDVARAKKLHEQRLTSEDSFAAWYEFAMFCMRQDAHERGEECFRKALVHDSTNLRALAALSCICWFKGGELDDMYFEDALVLAHAAKDFHTEAAMPWALLTMLLDASCPAATKTKEVRNAQFKAQQLALGDPDSSSTLQAAPFLELELLLLDMHLGTLALKTHAFAQRQSNNERFKLQLSLCKAQATALTGEVATAVNMLKTAVQGTAPGSQERATASVVLGKSCQQAGNLKVAQEAFEAAIQCCPENSPQEAYLHLGNLYMQQELFEYAADVYTHACSSYPCGSSWLGLGLAHLRMGRLADADLMLAEAVTCDPHNPIPRSYLALIHILTENKDEACECLESAEKHGLADPGIMREIGEAFASKGMFHDAAAILRRALAHSSQPSFATLASLGEAHLACNELKAARAAWENARVIATSQEVEFADAALSNIKVLQGDQEEWPARAAST